MHPTVLGFILIPLVLARALAPMSLLCIALATGVLEAGAVLVIGGQFGLQPAMLPGLLFIAYVALQYALGMRYAGERYVIWAALPLLGLLGYALVSIYVLPQLFAGEVMVWPQKPDLVTPTFVPLAFSGGNITQTMYLGLNILASLAAALFISRVAIDYRKLMAAYLFSGYLAIGLAFWQFASRVAGVPFPDKIVWSNPGWAIVSQSMGSVPRIQGPFSEPAGLAFYLSGLFMSCLWLDLQGFRIMRVRLLMCLAAFTILLSTSTTGIACLGVSGPLVLIFSALRRNVGALRRLPVLGAVALLGGGLVLGPIVLLNPRLIDAADIVLQSTMTKDQGDSFEERTKIDHTAMATVGQTYGLGVGWGSFRTSSFVPGLLSNAGLPGTAMVLWAIWRVARLLMRAGRRNPDHPARILAEGCAAALCGQLLAAVISAPTIGSLGFFLELGCAIGAGARMLHEARYPAARAPAIARARPAFDPAMAGAHR